MRCKIYANNKLLYGKKRLKDIEKYANFFQMHTKNFIEFSVALGLLHKDELMIKKMCSKSKIIENRNKLSRKYSEEERRLNKIDDGVMENKYSDELEVLNKKKNNIFKRTKIEVKEEQTDTIYDIIDSNKDEKITIGDVITTCVIYTIEKLSYLEEMPVWKKNLIDNPERTTIKVNIPTEFCVYLESQADKLNLRLSQYMTLLAEMEFKNYYEHKRDNCFKGLSKKNTK